MIGRLIGFTAATLFTSAVVAGSAALIAADMFGSEALSRTWTAVITPSPNTAVSRDLDRATDITFFVKTSVSGHDFTVMTGTSFASARDFEARKVKARWCYIQVGHTGAIGRQLTLAQQEGERAPTYTDTSRFSDEDLQPFGLSAREAGRLARSHCQFGDVSVVAGSGP